MFVLHLTNTTFTPDVKNSSSHISRSLRRSQALIFILMANEMARRRLTTGTGRRLTTGTGRGTGRFGSGGSTESRRLETAWKLRHLAPYERVTLSWCESAWQAR